VESSYTNRVAYSVINLLLIESEKTVYYLKLSLIINENSANYLQGKRGGSPFTNPAGLTAVLKTEFFEPLII
jgi:hypothetical protein